MNDQNTCIGDCKSIIEISNLSKTFKTKNSEVKALEDINLQINEGEIFGIIGLSGAGKSTLVRCINYLETPTKGSIIFDGKDLVYMKQKELLKTRRSMSMIFQQFNLLMQRNALDNVCFPLEIAGYSKKEARKMAKELLETVGLSDKEKSYPAQLSGGQKQRVAIARALATNPKVLLCDEATSALDPTTTRSILKLLKEINKKFNITIIIITHEMKVIEEICTKVAIIDDSKIAEVGKVEEVFAKPKSEIAKKLIFPDTNKTKNFDGKDKYRIIFDGRNSSEPIMSNLVLECQTPINIDELVDGAKIAVPNDTSNEARALLLLEAEGLIKIKEGAGLNATIKDIIENPKNLEIIELEAAQIPRSLPDVDLAVINGNYAIEAGLKVGEDAIAVEGKDSEAANTYGNIIAIKTGDESRDEIKALIKALQTEKVKEYIEEKYEGAVIPKF